MGGGVGKEGEGKRGKGRWEKGRRVEGREERRENVDTFLIQNPESFYNLILEVTTILFALFSSWNRPVNPALFQRERIILECEYWEMGVIGGHFRGCLARFKGSTTLSEGRENLSLTPGVKSFRDKQNLGKVLSSLSAEARVCSC